MTCDRRYIFRPLLKSKTAMTTRAFRRRVDTYLRLAGLKRAGLSAHSMRGTSATLAMEAGATLIEIQRHLDHASPETTIKYLGRLDKVKDAVSQKIPLKL